jgi:cathepsin F
MESGGLMEQHAYSYKGVVGLSSFDPSRIVVRIANFTAVPAGEDGHIWALLVHRGPPAVGLHVLLMPTYVGGCRARSSARRRGVNYGVLLVSYGALAFAALRLGYWPYWVIKNSWGSRGRKATTSLLMIKICVELRSISIRIYYRRFPSSMDPRYQIRGTCATQGFYIVRQRNTIF